MAEDFAQFDFLGTDGDDLDEKSKSGDAIAMRYRVNDDMQIHIVDAGFIKTGKRLVELVKEHYNDPGHIHHVVATHGDQDHVSGLKEVLNEDWTIGTLWMLRPWEFAADLKSFYPNYANVNTLAKALRDSYPNLAALEDIAIDKGIRIEHPFQGTRIGAFTVASPTKEFYLEQILLSPKSPTPPDARIQKLREQVARNYQAQEANRQRWLTNLFEAAYKKAATLIWGLENFSAQPTGPENETSVVQWAKICDKTILLTGDAGREALTHTLDFLKRYSDTLPIDLLQIPHHGARRNLSSEIMDALVGGKIAESDYDEKNPRFRAYVMAAEADKDHPKPTVIRSVWHRGGILESTEGNPGFYTGLGFSIPRDGWTTISPVAYTNEIEED